MPVERLDMTEKDDIQCSEAFALGCETLELVGTMVCEDERVPELYHLLVGHVGDVLNAFFLAKQITE